MLVYQDTTSLGELLAPRAPSESLTPIADALFPLPACDFAALAEWKDYRRRLRRFAMRWHAVVRRHRRSTRSRLLVMQRRDALLAPVVFREFLDGLAELIAHDILRRRELVC